MEITQRDNPHLGTRRTNFSSSDGKVEVESDAADVQNFYVFINNEHGGSMNAGITPG
jgi:hypothetical protein